MLAEWRFEPDTRGVKDLVSVAVNAKYPREATVSPKSVGDRLLKRWQVLTLHNRARIPGQAVVGPEKKLHGKC
jgi:hypothetical protein